MFRRKKEKRWICTHCKRINDPTDKQCAFCKEPKEEEEQPSRIKKKTAYDELHLWPVFSMYIRLRDSDQQGIGQCFTCKRPLHWRKADCGHGAGRQYKGTKYNEQNNHLQCKRCNGFEGGARELYKEEMDKRYGPGTWDKMMVASRAATKLSRYEVDIMAEYYQKEVERLLAAKKEQQ